MKLFGLCLLYGCLQVREGVKRGLRSGNGGDMGEGDRWKVLGVWSRLVIWSLQEQDDNRARSRGVRSARETRRSRI